jgi:hypothetical protein
MVRVFLSLIRVPCMISYDRSMHSVFLPGASEPVRCSCANSCDPLPFRLPATMAASVAATVATVTLVAVPAAMVAVMFVRGTGLAQHAVLTCSPQSLSASSAGCHMLFANVFVSQ